MNSLRVLVMSCMLVLLSGCSSRWQTHERCSTAKEKRAHHAYLKTVPLADLEFVFDVENKTGKVLYVVGFIHAQRHIFDRWRWHRTQVYGIDPHKTVTVEFIKIPKDIDEQSVFGVLGVFETEQEAENATYELLDDSQRLDLHLMSKLKGKKVVIEVERYGFKKPFYDFDFVKKQEARKRSPELDFLVENGTGKPIIVCGFVYQRKAKTSWLQVLKGKDDASQWRFDKTPLVRLEPGQQGVIDVDSIEGDRDREYVQGFVAVFGEGEETLAQTATYELLEPWRKLTIGPLYRLKDKKVIIAVERYGIAGDIINFTPKQISRIDFTKRATGY